MRVLINVRVVLWITSGLPCCLWLSRFYSKVYSFILEIDKSCKNSDLF